jgi:hypothetical protein
MVASGGVTSAPGATVSAWGREVDSSATADESSSLATASGSSPSQDRSVDFLHNTHWVVSQPRLSKLHVLLRDGFHLQVRPDYSHSRSAKYAGDINKPGFRGCLFFNMGDYWLHGSSSRGGFWPPLFYRHRRLAGTSRLLCRLRHDFFNSGAGLRLLSVAPPTMSQSSSPPCSTGSDDGISCDSIVSMQYFKTRTRLLIRGTHLLGSGCCHLQLLGDALSCHIARPSQRRMETSLQASRRIFNKGNVG